jgi:hypothetical protein
MADKLTAFGNNFQVKTISALLTDKAFLQQVSDILLPEFFESDANSWIVENTIKYFHEFSQTPTLDVFKIKTSSITSDVMKMSVIDSLKEVYKHLESNDLDFIKDETVAFCKNQCIKRAILDSVSLLEKGEYDQIKLAIDNAMKAGADKAIGHEYNDEVELRYKDNIRSTIPTPWPVINDLADGGFGKGEMVVFVAPAGIGKCVGPKTEITIQYNEIGIPVIGNSGNEVIIWIKPWDKFMVGPAIEMYGWEVEELLTNTNGNR